MYNNSFLGMTLTDDGLAVAIYFLSDDNLAQEYLFKSKEEAALFHDTCLRFLEIMEDYEVTEAEQLFREFLDKNFVEMNYKKIVYK